MSTLFALNLAAAPLVSGLPVAPQDLSTGAIDPHALSELVSRSATFESKPIAIPECARKPPPNERPKIRNDIVVIQIWTAPSKNIPKGKLGIKADLLVVVLAALVELLESLRPTPPC